MSKPRTPKGKKKRSLATITRELNTVLKRKTVDIIDAGRLLLEAQEDHRGEFLSWLECEFRFVSQRTAYNYINAAKFARKFATVANLRLAPSALYLLGGLDDDDDVFTPEVVARIGAEAKKTWVDADRCREIAEPPAEPAAEETPEKDAEEGIAEPDAPAEGETVEPGTEEPAADDPVPPPLLPPPPESPPSPRDESQRAAFQRAIEKLKPLVTKPAAKFADVVGQNELIEAADFFNAVAKRKPVGSAEVSINDRRLENELIDLREENTALKAELETPDLRGPHQEQIAFSRAAKILCALAVQAGKRPGDFMTCNSSDQRLLMVDFLCAVAEAPTRFRYQTQIAELESEIAGLKARIAELEGDGVKPVVDGAAAPIEPPTLAISDATEAASGDIAPNSAPIDLDIPEGLRR